MNSFFLIDRDRGKLTIPDAVGSCIKKEVYRKMYHRNAGQNPANWSPTFYGDDRDERLKEYLKKNGKKGGEK